MTSSGSDFRVTFSGLIHGAIFFGIMVAAQPSPIEIAFVAIVMAWAWYRDHIRRKTLCRRDDGVYVWIEWHGGERSSATDPSEPGGEWDSEGDGDGGD